MNRPYIADLIRDSLHQLEESHVHQLAQECVRRGDELEAARKRIAELESDVIDARNEGMDRAARGILEIRAKPPKPTLGAKLDPFAPAHVKIQGIWMDAGEVRKAAKDLGMVELEAGRGAAGAELADLIRKRYPRLLERGNPLYDGTLDDAIGRIEEGGPIEAGRVVVPDYASMADAAWRSHFDPLNGPTDLFVAGCTAMYKAMCAELRILPADRVLGEEMVALRRFAERCAQRDHQPDEHIGSAKCVACEAEDALRANQGGAAT